MLITATIKIFRSLPRLPVLKFMRTAGRLVYSLLPGLQKKIIRHLTIAFGNEKPSAEIKLLAKQVFLHFSTVAADMIRQPVIVKYNLNELISAEGIEYIEKASANGRGVILLTAHFGNWELLGAWLAQNGYPMKVVGTSIFDPRLDKIVVETRNMAGYTNIARGRGTREIIRTLKQGLAIGMLIDQDTEVQGTFVNFFGKPAFTPTGPAQLARKFDIPIIPIFMTLQDDFSYHIVCEPPLELTKTDDESHDIQVITQQCSDVYERVIRQAPSQWAWMHKRWHKQPAANEHGYVICTYEKDTA